MALTPKQQRFVDEYLIDLNATQAAIRAGYPERSARSVGQENLTKPDIQAAIQTARQAQQERTQITSDRILQELALVGFGDIGQILDFSGSSTRMRPANEIPEKARRMIGSIKVKRYWEGDGDECREVEITEFKLWDKMSALEKLCRCNGMFVDRHEHTGKDGADLIVKVLGTGQTMGDL